MFISSIQFVNHRKFESKPIKSWVFGHSRYMRWISSWWWTLMKGHHGFRRQSSLFWWVVRLHITCGGATTQSTGRILAPRCTRWWARMWHYCVTTTVSMTGSHQSLQRLRRWQSAVCGQAALRFGRQPTRRMWSTSSRLSSRTTKKVRYTRALERTSWATASSTLMVQGGRWVQLGVPHPAKSWIWCSMIESSLWCE